MENVPRIALTADDDEFYRSALTFILSKHLGFSEVIETDSFDEALEQLAARTNVSLALFDLQMPGMDSPGKPANRSRVLSRHAHCHDLQLEVSQ